MLEDEVDEKYYLSEEQINRIRFSTFCTNKRRIQEKEYCDTLCARDWKDPKCVEVGDYRYDEGLRIRKSGLSPCLTLKTGSKSLSGNTLLIKNKSLKETLEKNEITKDISYIDAYNRNIRKDDLSGTITTRVSDSNNTFLAIKNNTKISDVENKIKVIGNYSPSGHDASRIVDSDGLAPTVKENHGTVTATNISLRIRKLTPKECWRLMGFNDEDFEKVQKVNSNTQLYKQAGNSIVVNVLEKIFKNLFKEGKIDDNKTIKRNE